MYQLTDEGWKMNLQKERFVRIAHFLLSLFELV